MAFNSRDTVSQIISTRPGSNTCSRSHSAHTRQPSSLNIPLTGTALTVINSGAFSGKTRTITTVTVAHAFGRHHCPPRRFPFFTVDMRTLPDGSPFRSPHVDAADIFGQAPRLNRKCSISYTADRHTPSEALRRRVCHCFVGIYDNLTAIMYSREFDYNFVDSYLLNAFRNIRRLSLI